MIIPLALSTALAAHGLRKRSLSPSGAAAGFLVGLVTFSHPDPIFGVVLVAFYQSGSMITKWGKAEKKQIEDDYHEEGRRNAWQVLCNGGLGTVLAAAHATWAFGNGSNDAVLSAAYLGFYACCAGDTFASEIGTAFASRSGWPYLITSGKRIPPGTNGGLTVIGTLASAAGGALVAVAAIATRALAESESTSWFRDQSALSLVVVGAGCGFLGSMIDSLLGATVQATYQDTERGCIVKRPGPGTRLVSGRALLNNDAVNFAAGALTALLAGGLAMYFS
ncbi:integral membrane protein DUF92-domain-containing protein [Blastocladiella britannica]|nr:integral membrane protein DUF92-domain-containing protein [Blastocladiella britannica]